MVTAPDISSRISDRSSMMRTTGAPLPGSTLAEGGFESAASEGDTEDLLQHRLPEERLGQAVRGPPRRGPTSKGGPERLVARMGRQYPIGEGEPRSMWTPLANIPYSWTVGRGTAVANPAAGEAAT